MGEWSDYFEDFPEENPANQDRQQTPLEQVRTAVTRGPAGKSPAQAELEKLIRQPKAPGKQKD